MTVPAHLTEAARRLERAEVLIRDAKDRPVTMENLQKWLAALTDYVIALSDVQRFTNESVHEKLHDIDGRAMHTYPAENVPQD